MDLDDVIDTPMLDDDDWKTQEFRQTVAAKLYVYTDTNIRWTCVQWSCQKLCTVHTNLSLSLEIDPSGVYLNRPLKLMQTCIYHNLTTL